MNEAKFAICQELFEGWSWQKQCEFIAETGYKGIEIAPFSLSGDLESFGEQQRNEHRKIAESNGLTVLGLHWLLARTEGYHLTTDDSAVRTRTAEYFRFLIDLCADLGGNLMVLGSPQQRNLQEGVSAEQAFDNAVSVLKECCPLLADRGVTLCFEPLSPKETDFCMTAQEGVHLIDAIGHPNVRLHLDVKAMLSEKESIPELIKKFDQYTSHFHANDGNLLGPGMGDTEFEPIFEALKESSYDGWVSVEVFDYKPSPEEIASRSIQYMQNVWNKVASN